MFSKPNAIVYLRRKDLIVGGKHIAPAKLTFTIDLIKNMEVQNSEVFIATCQEFFETHNLKGKKVQLILDQNIVFDKAVNAEQASKDDLDYVTQSYISQIPFEPGKRACVQYLLDDNLLLYATNNDLYQNLIDALKSVGIRKLVAITPSSAYEIDYNVKFSAIMKQFIEDKKIRKNTDFSTATVL